MRPVLLALSIVMLTSPAARADDADDPRAIMQKAAAEQAETTPANVPSAEASATAKTRADGQQAQLERTTRAASASARRAAITAARAAAGDPTLTSGTIPSTARNARTRNTSADAGQRGATGVAQEHAVRTGSGHGGPPTGGRP